MLVITNLTACADYNIEITLKEFARKTYDIEYNPNKFSGAILRFRSPKSTCVVFSNGKVNCIGCKNLSEAKMAIRICANKLIKSGFKPIASNFRVVNYAGAATLRQKLDLDKLAEFLGKNARYDPELFCGLIYTFPNCKVTIHNSGKIILTGSNAIRELREALNVVIDKIFEFHFLELE
jgi:transcription initiation factor TFIID TATA-box-binding protein